MATVEQQKAFIKKYASYAVEGMKQDKILASLTIAQALLESGVTSTLAVEHNNLFGIKGTGDAGSVTLPTKEWDGKKMVTVNAKFAKYKTALGSFKRHNELFLNGVSWDRNKYRNLIGVTDYKVACKLVQKDGYATDPKYTDKLITLIEKFDLHQYDKVAEHKSSIPDYVEDEYEQLVKWGIFKEGDHPNPNAVVKASEVWKLVHDAIKLTRKE